MVELQTDHTPPVLLKTQSREDQLFSVQAYQVYMPQLALHSMIRKRKIPDRKCSIVILTQ